MSLGATDLRPAAIVQGCALSWKRRSVIELLSDFQSTLASENKNVKATCFHTKRLGVRAKRVRGSHQCGVDHSNVVRITPMWCGSHQCGADHTTSVRITPMWCGPHQCGADHTNVVRITPMWCGYTNVVRITPHWCDPRTMQKIWVISHILIWSDIIYDTK